MTPHTPRIGDLITYRFGRAGLSTLGLVLDVQRPGTWRGFTVTLLTSPRGDVVIYDVGDDEVVLSIFTTVATTASP